ncbi:MAG: peptidylprolyl isomerase [Sneathiellales bacterium]|nr:peptidylprolyl isomerase [Sneathiellales bacterium]
MKIGNFLAFLIVAGLSMALGYFIGTDMKGLPMQSEEGKPAVAENAPDPNDKVVATVDAAEIRESEVRKMYENLPAQYRQAPYQLVKAQLVEQLVNMKIIQNAALAGKYEDQPEFMEQLDTVRLQVLQEYFLQRKIDEAVTEEALKAEYEKENKDFKPETEVRARHILLKEEQEAKDVITQLDGGADFAELAKELSTGPSGKSGGDLGYFVKARMVPPFAEAAFAMDVGSHSKEPVQTQFGWHVIKVEDKRDTQPPAFETRRQALESELTNTTVTSLLETLKKAANVSIVRPEGETPADDKKEEEKKDG